MSAILHPVMRPVVGHAASIGAWDEARSSERLHHGWMFQGPRGVGKFHLAVRLAAELLGMPRTPEAMTEANAHPIARLVEAGSHPDLRIVQIPVDDKGKPKSEIPVDLIRELSRFFMMRPAMGGWRIAIVDSLDVLNRNGANALLKTLEEPPPNCVLILIAHGSLSVLPTIRSRCRVLRFGKLSAEETRAVLVQNGLSAADADAAVQAAPGQPGLALTLVGGSGAAAIKAAQAVLSNRRGDDAGQLRQFVNSADAASFDAAIAALSGELLARAKREGRAGRAGRLATAASDVMKLGQEAVGLNMDRSQALASVLQRIQADRLGET